MKKFLAYILITVTAIFLVLFFQRNVKKDKEGNNASSNFSSNKHSEVKSISDINTNKKRVSENRVEAHENWFPEKNVSALSAGGIKIPLSFESDVSQELQNVIAYDLNLIFGHLKEHEYLDASRAPQLSIKGKTIQPDKFLKLTGKGRFFPKQLVGKIGFMSGETLIIPDTVIQEYKKAWDRKNKNEAKYRSLLNKLTELNNLATEPALELPSEWFFISPKAKTAGMTFPEISSEEFVKSFSVYSYRQPSLLDVFEGDLWDTQLSDKLIAKLYVSEASSSVIKNSMPPLICDDGEWKFYIGVPPT